MRIFLSLLLSIGYLWGQPAFSHLQQQIFEARDRVLPALVHVEPIIKVFARGEKQHALVTGSGVIFSEEGYVLTNDHVAGNAEKVWCTLSNKEKITASVVGRDPSTDIAVLKLNLDELTDKHVHYARLGNSDSLEVGQIVLALGSPLGLSRSVSMGVISSIDRYFPDRGSMISPYNLWIQTDAAINPGNSGGPLINLDGRVIGINARAVFFAENLGFAIPINLAREVSGEILRGNSVKRAWIGMEIQQLKDFKEYLELPGDFDGVLVSDVQPNSPAEKAGLKAGDVIQSVGGTAIHGVFEENLPAIRKVLANLPIGSETAFGVWRNHKLLTLKVKTAPEPFGEEEEFEASRWGIVIENLSWGIFKAQMLDDFEGVYVSSVKPGSPGELSNIRAGDVIRRIDGEKIANSAGFQQLYGLLSGESSRPIFVEMVRGGYPFFAVLKMTPTP